MKKVLLVLVLGLAMFSCSVEDDCAYIYAVEDCETYYQVWARNNVTGEVFLSELKDEKGVNYTIGDTYYYYVEVIECE